MVPMGSAAAMVDDVTVDDVWRDENSSRPSSWGLAVLVGFRYNVKCVVDIDIAVGGRAVVSKAQIVSVFEFPRPSSFSEWSSIRTIKGRLIPSICNWLDSPLHVHSLQAYV
jgi:hypothetical protein